MKKKQQKEKPANTKEKKVVQRRQFSAKEKVEAVLSVWSERRKPREVCKDLGISWTVLNNWQNTALSAVWAALEPRVRGEEDRGPALPAKLEKMLKKKIMEKSGKATNLEKRLEKIQDARKKSS